MHVDGGFVWKMLIWKGISYFRIMLITMFYEGWADYDLFKLLFLAFRMREFFLLNENSVFHHIKNAENDEFYFSFVERRQLMSL